MSKLLVNQANAHTGTFLSSNEGAVVGCEGKGLMSNGSCGIKQFSGLKGGQKSRKRRGGRKKRGGTKRRRRRGGSPHNYLAPYKGMAEMLTRGNNASREGGLSTAERRTLKGGYISPKTRKINLYMLGAKGGSRKRRGGTREVLSKVQKHAAKTAIAKTAAPTATAKFAGGGYAYTPTSAKASFGAHSLGQGYHNHSTVPVSSYRNCGLLPKFKMGAGANYVGTKAIQKGAGPSKYPSNQKIPIMPTDGQNQLTTSSYGYTDLGDPQTMGHIQAKYLNAALFAPGHAQVTNLSHPQRCNLNGGRRKKKGGTTLLSKMVSGVANIPDKVSQKVDQVTGDPFIDVHAAGGGRRKRKRKRKGKRKTRKRRKTSKRRSRKQKGGYAQYHSNVPLTWTQQLPAGKAGGSWEGQLANPAGWLSTNICHNNYNHFLGTNTPSPVLDQGPP